MVARLLPLPARQGARLLTRDLLETLRATADQLTSRPSPAPAPAPAALHDFRVAVRRLRSFLRAYASHLGDAAAPAIQRQLRVMTAATGTNRDLDVQLGWLKGQTKHLTERERVGAAWLVRRLEQRRRDRSTRLPKREARRLARVTRRLEAELEEFTLPVDVVESALQPTLALATADRLDQLVNTFETRLAAIQSIDDREAAHRARITGKRLRYLIEPLASEIPEGAELVDQFKGLQDLLGEFNDAHQFGMTLADDIARATSKQERRFSRAVLKGKVLDEGWLRRARARDPSPGLAALRRRLQHREEEAFERIARWLVNQAPILKRRLTAAGRALRRIGPRDREIERKYLLRSLPDLVVGAAAQHIDQGYLPGSQLVERVRRVRLGGEERFYRTVKLGKGVERVEIEEETSAEVFQAMWPLTSGRRVRKRRYRVVYGDLTWEIDEFLDHPLILAEVELPVATLDPTPPEWLRPYVVRQVSGEPEYLNMNLAC